MTPAATTLACPKCATPFSKGTRFCGVCGTDVTLDRSVAVAEQGTMAMERDELLPLVMEATLGDYDIYGLLGRGGMASVYLALDISLNRKVAIKVMSPALIHGDDAIARFKREAQTAAGLSHPHIIPIHSVKQASKIVYFVMKYIEGRPLDSIIKELGALPVEMAVSILAQVGGALHYAHKRGIVHRDIKPANIMIDEDGQAIVTDFGIAKVQEAKGLTMTGATVGTPAYMSPEQYEGVNITGAADQYSLGVVAYEMLTGHPPFGGNSIMTVMKGHMLEAPPPITAERGDLPPMLASTVMQMLEKKPEDRLADCGAVVANLHAKVLADSHPVRTQLIELARTGAMMRPRMSVPMSPVPAGKVPKPASAAAASPARPSGPTSTKKTNTALIGGIAAVVLVAAGGGYYAVQQRTAPSAVAAPQEVPASTAPSTTPVAAETPPTATPDLAAGNPPTSAAPSAPVVPPPTAVPEATEKSPTLPPAAPVKEKKAVQAASNKVAASKAALSKASTNKERDDIKARLLAQEQELLRLREQNDAAKLSLAVKADAPKSVAPAPAAKPVEKSPEKPADKPADRPAASVAASGAADMGTLRIGLNVEDAKLEINGESKGTLGSAVRSLQVKAGTIRWAVRKDGCTSSEGTATVEPGGSVTVPRSKATPSCP